jgi:hypothetical protein
MPFLPSAFSTTVQSGAGDGLIRLPWAAALAASIKGAQQARREKRLNTTAEFKVSQGEIETKPTADSGQNTMNVSSY